MSFEAKKTEHCGPKLGKGPYCGYKGMAKNNAAEENLSPASLVA